MMTTCPLELLHSDLCGPMSIPSLNWAQYILTITNDFSHYIWVHPISHKSNMFHQFQRFKKSVEAQFHLPISCLQANHGGEYLTTDFNTFLDAHGIRRQLTTVQTPYQNGIAKQKNCTLLECACSLAIDANILTTFWDELVLTANPHLIRS